MKVVEKENATAPLAAYTEEVGKGARRHHGKGKPVAVLVMVENADLETVSLSTNRRFIDLIERARAEGGVSSGEMRRRLG